MRNIKYDSIGILQRELQIRRSRATAGQGVSGRGGLGAERPCSARLLHVRLPCRACTCTRDLHRGAVVQASNADLGAASLRPDVGSHGRRFSHPVASVPGECARHDASVGEERNRRNEQIAIVAKDLRYSCIPLARANRSITVAAACFRDALCLTIKALSLLRRRACAATSISFRRCRALRRELYRQGEGWVGDLSLI